MSEMRRIWAVIWKDTLTERRTKAAFNAMAFFAGIVLLIFAFALGPDTPGFGPAGQTLLQYVSPGLLWVAILLTAVLALGRANGVGADPPDAGKLDRAGAVRTDWQCS